ncbi:MAG: helicase HerA domain-containing protein [Halorhabdus sp.]
MATDEARTITVADHSGGVRSHGEPGTPVSVPVVEVLTGRGFITGKSGSGKSNSASVIAENLLDEGFGLLIVDIDGEYYGLKEEYEILHAGGDEECDVEVTTDHAGKLASLALEQNVPIILDVSSFLDEDEARELLTAVARQLFAKAKKCKQPFLMLVEEIHEYIPENGGLDECGRMLIKVGKRGRKHGLGIAGISQRPADVKKDFITQCDWLVWHRLTWNNDTTVVRRILDGEYADAVEDLDDGEAFLMTDWAESVQRVQFHRKQTFDAGATPGLDDFERPDLKSVSDDLVTELASISEQREETEDRIAELREELDRKNSRIAELEAELQDARDMSRMADQFVDALVEHVDGVNPGRTAQERMRQRHTAGVAEASGPAQVTLPDVTAQNAQTTDGNASAATGTTEEFAARTDVEHSHTATNEDGRQRDRSDERPAGGAPGFVGQLRAEIRSLAPKTRRMLAYYRDQGPASPLDAHFVAGGSGDRTSAYARNRTLRTAGLIEHVGRGTYEYRVPELIAQRAPADLSPDERQTYLTTIEQVIEDEGDGTDA